MKKTNVRTGGGQPLLSKGFTLIELLAVIVILAIIALIAVPIILNIIKNSKNESNKRSIEMYAKAIENAIIKEQMDEQRAVVGSFNTSKIETELNVQYEGEKVGCDTIEIYEDGSIHVAECNINGTPINYSYGTNKTKVCQLANDGDMDSSGTITIGDKYECEVEEGKNPYIFYVLTTPSETDTKVNLILNTNICEDGSLIESGKSCQYDWINEGDYITAGGKDWNALEDLNYFGPVTAVSKLNNATIKWRKELDFNEIYEYKNNKNFNLGKKARLPKKEEITDKNEINTFLYDNLYDMLGYWTYTPKEDSNAYNAFFKGYVYSAGVNGGYYGIGIRPVISVPRTMIA